MKNNPKIRKCSFEGCDEGRMKRPNSTIYFKYCAHHQIQCVLKKQNEQKANYKAGLEKMRKTSSKTPQEQFYSSSAWRNCSRYVLLHYSDENLMVRCSTSPHLEYHVTDKSIHCGHFHKSDSHKAVALEFKNLAPQGAADNIHFSGKPEVMAIWIENTHGKGTLEWLDIEKNKTVKLDKYEMDKISKHYLGLLNAELKERNKKNPWK